MRYANLYGDLLGSPFVTRQEAEKHRHRPDCTALVRIWPHGTRPGDVQPEGTIRLDPAKHSWEFTPNGRVMVTIAQAFRAMKHGWKMQADPIGMNPRGFITVKR